MRVPIYPKDTYPKLGFSKLVSILQNIWCGPGTISPSFAREIISKGLGYLNYRDLYQSSKRVPREEDCPTETEIRHSILAAIKAELQPDEWLATNQADWERIVNALPLNELSVFKSSPIDPSQIARPVRANEKSDWKQLSADRQLTSQQLWQITSTIASSGSLRDQALLGCLLSGLRPREFLPAKVNQIVISTDRVFIEADRKRASAVRCKVRIPNPGAISRHVELAKLSPNDFLFASDKIQHSPMSELELRELCASWALKSGILPSLVVPSIIRQSANKDWLARVQKMPTNLGHKNYNFTQRYFYPKPDDVDE
ncbi:tyrosine-type recombinase/integrase [Pseudomonas putida]|uniref:Tyrosine-type recombinase/integrase n=1 Tax=Pseudomonas putida TaxID=303 RepID=A0AAP9MYC3_PSEPU|nr:MULTISPECIES: tyrosine-type recombinase/integrase [Pseudomonas]MBP2838645.1 tyrosine-type recombinase/integrase [Pseudomonas sp. PNP]QJQ09783.1 tyrosine-type recombinase/integrase [Pseudomonas putida]